MLRIDLGHKPIDSYFSNHLGNTFEYLQTNETFGIASLPANLIHSFNMKPLEDSSLTRYHLFNSPQTLLDLSILPVAQLPVIGYSNANFVYTFLAKCQKISLAVTAVHTSEELSLFKKLLVEKKKDIYTKKQRKEKKDENEDEDEDDNDDQLFPSKNPCFIAFAIIWSSYCNESSNIYYKLPEQLRAHYNILEDRKKYGESVSLNRVVSQEVRQITQSNTRCVKSIQANPQPRPPPPPPQPPTRPLLISSPLPPPTMQSSSSSLRSIRPVMNRNTFTIMPTTHAIHSAPWSYNTSYALPGSIHRESYNGDLSI
jgi:hypothetical protein